MRIGRRAGTENQRFLGARRTGKAKGESSKHDGRDEMFHGVVLSLISRIVTRLPLTLQSRKKAGRLEQRAAATCVI